MAQIREIEFRAQTVYDGKWVYGFPMHYATPHYDKWTIREPTGLEHDVEPETICEYTGWNPRNCPKLYENDVIEFDDWAFTPRQRKKMKHHRGVIKWAVDYGQWLIHCNDRIYDGNSVADPKLIGNIFENPELVKDV